MAPKPLLVLSTIGDSDHAEQVARTLVEEQLAACINVIPGVRSIYRWQGEICSESEVLMIVKTTSERFEQLRERLRELHAYDLPEIVALQVEGADPEYLAWLCDQVSLGAGDC